MSRLQVVSIPSDLQRNAPDVLVDGVEETGGSCLTALARRIDRPDLAGLDLLDVGCGVRFTQTLINRGLPFSSYTGIEVCRPIVEWLKEHVEKHDDRFRFVLWNVQNSMYNPQAPLMNTFQTFPVAGSYDLVMGFSLVTHLAPQDAAQIFRLARMVVRPDGFLFFSAFCDDAIDKFEDRVPGEPLLNAYYNTGYLEGLISEAGWALVSHEGPAGYILDSFLCKPVNPVNL
jgi:SAM-dependent methyltransferase